MVAISGACLSPFFSGTPEATMWASLTVSTCNPASVRPNLTNPSQSEALFITTCPRYHHEISHLEDVILAQATVKHLVEGVEECHHLNRKQVKILKVMMLITSAGELSSTVWMKSTRSLKYMVTESNLTAFILLRC